MSTHSDDVQQMPLEDDRTGWFVGGVRHRTRASVERALADAGVADVGRITDRAIGQDGDYPSVPHSWRITPQPSVLGLVEYRDTPRPDVIAGSVLNGTLVYHWADRDAFARHMLSLGGSGDTSGGRVIATDADWHVGRYPRRAHPDRHTTGTTMSFYCSWYNQPSARGVVILAGAPWASATDRDAVYAFLASAGVTPNDATAAEEAIAAAVLKTPDPAPGLEDRAVERAKREGVI